MTDEREKKNLRRKNVKILSNETFIRREEFGGGEYFELEVHRGCAVPSESFFKECRKQ